MVGVVLRDVRETLTREQEETAVEWSDRGPTYMGASPRSADHGGARSAGADKTPNTRAPWGHGQRAGRGSHTEMERKEKINGIYWR